MSSLEVRELTSSGRGAVAVLELRGAGALQAVARLAPRARLTPGALSVAVLKVAEVELDSALIVVRDECCVELHLHGSPSVVAEVLHQLAPDSPASPALELEQQALDLLGAAPCEAAARMLLDQAQGALRREIERLLRLAADEASEGLEQLLETARIARYALQPARVLLCGPVNAGKSTLFNALHGSERVLVSDEAGTTRDVVFERLQLGAWPIDLWDTPGHRAGQSAQTRGLELEQAGLRLAEELAADADVLLWLVAVDQEAVSPPAAQDARWIVLSSCGDRTPADKDRRRPAALCALRDPAGAAHALELRLCAHLGLPPDPWQPGRAVPFAAWQQALLESALRAPPARRRADLAQLLAPHGTPPRSERVAADAPVR